MPKKKRSKSQQVGSAPSKGSTDPSESFVEHYLHLGDQALKKPDKKPKRPPSDKAD